MIINDINESNNIMCNVYVYVKILMCNINDINNNINNVIIIIMAY